MTPVVAQFLRIANAIGGWQKSARLTVSWIRSTMTSKPPTEFFGKVRHNSQLAGKTGWGGASESFGEFAKNLDVVYGDAFTSHGQHAVLLPLGEQAAHGKQSRAGHLC